MTQIQDLRDRVALLKRDIVEETDGSFKELWQETDWVWAQVLPCSSREAIGEGWIPFALAQARYKVTMRYRRGRFGRVKWGDVTLALLCPPFLDPRRQWLTCMMYGVKENDE